MCHSCFPRSGAGYVSRYHQAGGHQLRAQQRSGRQEVAAGNHGRGVRVHRLRQRRLSRHSAGERQGLDHAGQALDAEALSQQSQRHVHRRDREVRTGDFAVRHGRGRRRLRQRRLRRHLRFGAGTEPPVPQQRQRDVYRRDQGRGNDGPERVQHQRRVGRLRPRRQARPDRRQLRAVESAGRHLLHPRRNPQVLLHAGVVQGRIGAPVAQPRQRQV